MIDIAKLYSTGYPNIGTTIRYSGGEYGRVIDVTIKKQRLEQQNTPRVVIQFMTSDGRPKNNQDYSLEEYHGWLHPQTGHKIEKVGPYEVVSPRIIP